MSHSIHANFEHLQNSLNSNIYTNASLKQLLQTFSSIQLAILEKKLQQ